MAVRVLVVGVGGCRELLGIGGWGLVVGIGWLGFGGVGAAQQVATTLMHAAQATLAMFRRGSKIKGQSGGLRLAVEGLVVGARRCQGQRRGSFRPRSCPGAALQVMLTNPADYRCRPILLAHHLLPGGAKGKDTAASDPAAALERPVVNCLGCGKIYDCRALSNDTLDFLSEWYPGFRVRV